MSYIKTLQYDTLLEDIQTVYMLQEFCMLCLAYMYAYKCIVFFSFEVTVLKWHRLSKLVQRTFLIFQSWPSNLLH